ncbi:Protein of unknown function (DUF2922) [[Clostridium] sordellii]|uniref:Protein of uncharacterized function (DUF2922) n=1 Tax=Paraclostridium sordellii TaxID=1505 RepID=A0A0A8VR72_PARSO|nr:MULTISPECIES: DUF2922 domain-containing protein [Paeniclostridium]MDU5021018.1 DUF2922 domain-containing protein [Clostridiales bacterium]MDU7941885.1 DUF2922 domain-containing protein [Citrobacter freundii]EPZ57781.1 hypothetical protein H476_1265 [[Clostridium] sordellii VPI 9048] [Paeniclostridium sordellii VPI 9048]MBS6022515.1 DUF2922 domain-containing protein [Paeniclostridium sordellii]MBW4863694.1 DUF2922 domain-containing protein [Paeniclostridium sp.]
METTKRLVMSFKNTLGRVVSISVDDPREDVTEAEIKKVMDMIVEKNIFVPNGADIVEAVEAKVVVTDTTEFDLVV